MNLLIVEDEIRLRSSLAYNIPWDQHNIEVIGLAADGKEAIKLVEVKKPDIILLDIQIPEIDGIELARRVKSNYHDIEIIILSGHDNFVYAQTALEIGVFKYLLKPAGEEEIIAAVVAAAALLKQRLEQKLNMTVLHKKWEEHLPRLQDIFLLNVIYGKELPEQITAKSNELQLNLSSNQLFSVAVLDMDPLSESEKRFSSNDTGLLQFILMSMAKEVLQETSPCWIVSDINGYVVILFELPLDNRQEGLLIVHQSVAKLISSVKTYLSLTASAGISGSIGDIEHLNKMYQQALSALQERLVYGHNIVIPYQEKLVTEEFKSIEPYMEKELEIALETADTERALHILKQWWDATIEASSFLGEVQEFVLYLSSFYIRIIHKQGWVVKEVMGNDFSYFQNLQALSTKQQTYQWITRITKNYIEFMKCQKKSISHQAIKTILDLIEKEMNQELTLQMVADKLYINSSYLSRLFKQETGKSFSSYVLERKMETAKQILLKGSKIYDAANMTGFKDPSYFTKVFRKYWGVTPGEITK